MSESDTSYPTYPPGLWRRIILQPGPGWIGGALEDDMHSFRIRIDHADGQITAMSARAVRTPWTACTGAAGHISAELTGERLADVAARDPAQQCTHLYDLAVVAAAHADDSERTIFDMRVADRVGREMESGLGAILGGGRTTATLSENGAEKLRWQLDGTIIEGPDDFAGRDIKRVSKWKHDYPPDIAEYAVLMRRAIFISPGRQYEPEMDKHASEMGPMRMGVCFNYQLPQAEESLPIFDRREFSMSGKEPLEGIDPVREFVEMASG